MIQAVDIAVTFGGHLLLLIRRAKPPFMDRLVLPGGHVESGERLAEAAARELWEETGLIVAASSLLALMTLDSPDRDPRPGKRVSTVFTVDLPIAAASLADAASDAAEIAIREIDGLRPDEIGFDHHRAIETIRSKTATRSL